MEIFGIILIIVGVSLVVVQPFTKESVLSTNLPNETAIFLQNNQTAVSGTEPIGPSGSAMGSSNPQGAATTTTSENVATAKTSTGPVKVGSVSIESGGTFSAGEIGK